jgi:hypothetical protein
VNNVQLELGKGDKVFCPAVHKCFWNNLELFGALFKTFWKPFGDAR